MQHRNNQLVVCAGLILAFVCAIPVKWYTLKDVRMTGGELWPFKVTATGFDGSINLLFDTPIWLLLTISAFFMVVVTTNVLRVTSVPWQALATGLILPGIDYLRPFFAPAEQLTVAAGPVLALVATLIALAFVYAQATAPRPAEATLAAARAES